MSTTDMGPVDLKPGGWRDLEVVYGKVPHIALSFRVPAGVQIRVRYGYGWAAWNTQVQTTDGTTVKTLKVDGWVGRARLSAKVNRETELSWKRITAGP